MDIKLASVLALCLALLIGVPTRAKATNGTPASIPLVERLKQDGNLLWGCDIILAAADTADASSGQRFRVLIDTGSSDLWLASKSCASEACLARRRFDPAKATKLEFSNNRTITLNYGGNSEVSGVEAKSRLQIAGVTIERQSFLLADKLVGTVFNKFNFDGVLGLGTKFLSRLKALTPLEQMIKQKLIPAPVFSLHLNPGAYLNDQIADGELTFGSIHRNYSHHELKNVSLMTNMRWQFRLSKVSLKSRSEDFQADGPPRVLMSVCTRSSSCSALVDTGTPLIRGLSAEVRRLNEYLGAKETANGLFAFPNCSMIDQLPNLVFGFSEGDDLELEPRDYVLERPTVDAENKSTLSCYSGLVIQDAEEYHFWILGNIFLARFHSVFDLAKQRVGFVKLHDDLERKYLN